MVLTSSKELHILFSARPTRGVARACWKSVAPRPAIRPESHFELPSAVAGGAWSLFRPLSPKVRLPSGQESAPRWASTRSANGARVRAFLSRAETSVASPGVGRSSGAETRRHVASDACPRARSPSPMVAAGAAIGPPGASLGWLASRRRRRNAGTATLRARRRLAIPGTETAVEGRGRPWRRLAELRRGPTCGFVRAPSGPGRCRCRLGVPTNGLFPTCTRRLISSSGARRRLGTDPQVGW